MQWYSSIDWVLANIGVDTTKVQQFVPIRDVTFVIYNFHTHAQRTAQDK